MGNARPYSGLGEVLDRLARRRNVRGPYRVANYITEELGTGSEGSHWSQIFHGEKNPSRKTLREFRRAFQLDDQEIAELGSVFVGED